jgi:hypothetical protein
MKKEQQSAEQSLQQEAGAEMAADLCLLLHVLAKPRSGPTAITVHT